MALFKIFENKSFENFPLYSISFERHNRLLAMERTKPKSNVGKVKELMKMSFAIRRNDILENGHNFNILQKYPFLQESEHVRYSQHVSSNFLLHIYTYSLLNLDTERGF